LVDKLSYGSLDLEIQEAISKYGAKYAKTMFVK
jgi:hypothetical protein